VNVFWFDREKGEKKKSKIFTYISKGENVHFIDFPVSVEIKLHRYGVDVWIFVIIRYFP